MKDVRILITGVAGLIGSQVAKWIFGIQKVRMFAKYEIDRGIYAYWKTGECK